MKIEGQEIMAQLTADVTSSKYRGWKGCITSGIQRTQPAKGINLYVNEVPGGREKYRTGLSASDDVL